MWQPPAIEVAAHAAALLSASGLEGVPALRGVSLEIARGEFLIILGSSGGGKTSLLNILGTISRPLQSLCGSPVGRVQFAHLRMYAAFALQKIRNN